MPKLCVPRLSLRRSAAFVFTTAAIVLAGGVVPHAHDVQTLERGRRVEGTLGQDETHKYRVALDAGDFLLVRVDKYDLELVCTVTDPDGSEMVKVQGDANPFEPEFVALIAEATGDFQLSVRQPKGIRNTGRYAVAIELARPALPQDRVRIDAERAVNRVNQLLALNRSAQDLSAALEDATSALESFRHLGLRQRELKLLIDVIRLQWQLGRPVPVDAARNAERLAREIDDRPALATATSSEALLLEHEGDIDAALRQYAEAVRLAHAVGSRQTEALFLSNEGVAYGRIGESEEAIVRFERARELTKQVDYRGLETGLLNNLGVAYKNVGLFDKALEAYRRALAIHQEGRQVANQILLLNNLGNVEQLLGRNQDALADHLRALDLSRQIGSADNEARSLNTIGQTYFALGDYAKSLDYHRQSLTIRRKLADLQGQGVTLASEGRALRRLGDFDGALNALDESLAIQRRIQDRSGQANTLRDRAEVERSQGRTAEAIDDIRAAVDLDEALRSRLTSPELRTSFVAFEHDKYELLVDLLQQQAHIDPDGGHEMEALSAAERGRARVLLESLLDARADFRQSADRELIDRERAVQRQLNTASLQLSRLLTRNGAQDQIADAARKVDDLTHRYEDVQAEIRRQNPRYADATQPRALTTAEIQNSVLDPDTVLLEFELGEERSWVWAVTPSSLTSAELPRRGDIDAAARHLIDQVTARQRRKGETPAAYTRRVAAADRSYARSAAALSDLLFGPIARSINEGWRGKRLAIVATGSLEYVPFGALPPPHERASAAAGSTLPRRAYGTRLAREHEIVSLPSASVVAALRRESSGRPAATDSIAILADPVFETDDPRVQARATSDEERRSVSPVDTAVSFNRLPFSRDEATAIAKLAGADRVFAATDFNASREAVLNNTLTRYRIVHFATHAVVDSERPGLTGLVLSLVNRAGAPQNGYLRLHDIYSMRLDADLVVLSACQTALGKSIKGEGLVGLARAFMYAGAPRVVASLWEVSDLATAELMKRFYAGMLQRGLRPAAALRAAQISMSRDPRWAHPYYWAGFVMQGDWR